VSSSLKITAVYPQSLSGNVKDANTNSNISASKVQITNLDNGITDSVFTNSTGNWYYSLITSVEKDGLIIPNSLVVDQNFPNPFNPSTRIQFSLPYDEYVEISVHNILGELIDHKAQFLSSGNYSIDWFSKGSAGVYFYTIKMVHKKYIQTFFKKDKFQQRITFLIKVKSKTKYIFLQ
jgi:hypothetical protein